MDAFRVKVSQLESDLRASEERKTSLQAILQSQGVQAQGAKEASREPDSYTTITGASVIFWTLCMSFFYQIRMLEQSKTQLEAVNDSLAAQVKGNEDLITVGEMDEERSSHLFVSCRNYEKTVKKHVKRLQRQK